MMVRFAVTNAQGQQLELTDWLDEISPAVATSAVMSLRRHHGNDARIAVERQGIPEFGTPPTFRYDIFVKEGKMPVIDEDGTAIRTVLNTTLQSRPFQAAEREKVLAAIREQFPDAVLTEVKVR